MRIAVVHGYYLHDSGSGSYVRDLTRALVSQGHDVTLVCQERRPERDDFINELCVLDRTNTTFERTILASSGRYPGRCRLVRPDLGGRLLVYVRGPFEGFDTNDVQAFQDAPTEWIDEYVARNERALRTTFELWKPELVIANHGIMQPCVVRRALDGAAPYVATIHGSELNFSIRADPDRLVPYAIEGLGAAAAVVAVSEPASQEIAAWAAQVGLGIGSRLHVVSPGLQSDVFVPAAGRAEAIEALREAGLLPAGFEVGTLDDVVAFAGRLGWTKGIQHAIAALYLAAGERPTLKMLVAGDGPARPALEELASLFCRGDVDGARRLAASDLELRSPDEYGEVVPRARAFAAGERVAFMGHLSAGEVARVFAAADVSVAPSVFPEAVGLVTIEALASGAAPAASYHSGLTSLLDSVADALGDDAFTSLTPGADFTARLARSIVHVLENEPTADPVFRSRMHELAILSFPSWEGVAVRYLELALTSG